MTDDGKQAELEDEFVLCHHCNWKGNEENADYPEDTFDCEPRCPKCGDYPLWQSLPPDEREK